MEHLGNRLKQLLLLLLEATVARDGHQSVNVGELRRMLHGAGFDDEDLADLLTWSRGRWSADRDEMAWLSTEQFGRASTAALRQMGPDEDELLTVPAFGYLLDLVRTRQITAEQMESMIQFAQLAPEAPLSMRDLTVLLDHVVFAEMPGGAAVNNGVSGRMH